MYVFADVHLTLSTPVLLLSGNIAIRPVAGVDPAALYAKIKSEITS